MLFRYSKFTVDNLIHLVLDSAHDLQPTLWYICDFHSWRNSENWPITRSKSPSSSPSSELDDATKKDLSLPQEQQNQQLVQREKLLEKKEKDLAQREKTIAQKEKNLAQKENLLQRNLLQAELREREALEFEQEAKIKLDEVDEKEQELEAEKEKLALTNNKKKGRFSTTTTSSIPTHHNAENADDDDNPTTTNETNNNDTRWLLRFSNLQQRLEIAYREIENLRRPVSSAATITNNNITTANATANGDNDNNDNDNDEDNDSNEKSSSSIITSLQHELKLTKENAQKQKEENILLRKTMNQSKNLDERNVSSLRRRGIRDNLDVNNLVDVDEVGNRWAPLNFRVERMRDLGMGSAMGRGRRGGEEEEEIVGMIEMQKEFKFLERLR